MLFASCSGGGGNNNPPVDPCYGDDGGLLPSCSTSVSCRDEDSDGYTVGAPANQDVGLVACSLKSDCDDVNEGIFPGAIEILNDAIDQNCDGVDGVNPSPSPSPEPSPEPSPGPNPGPSPLPETDTDGDGVSDASDNCIAVPNADQADSDGDGFGDACDSASCDPAVDCDSDGDGIPDATDNCPSSPDNADNDGDGTGNGCDNDDDGDGVLDASDNCLLTSNPQQEDNDADGVGAACDSDEGGVDTDGDGVADLQDNCPSLSNDQADADADGVGDACDTCPDDATANCNGGPSEGCVIGNAVDEDCDGITILEAGSEDNCPSVTNPNQADVDGDGIGDVCEKEGCLNNSDTNCGFTAQELDEDGDGVPNTTDNCTSVANPNQANFDNDGSGDLCDDDQDGDGLKNTIDPNNTLVNTWGYFDKEETSAQCVQEFVLLVPMNVEYISGIKKGTALGAGINVGGAIASKAQTPRRKNCKQVIVPNASGVGGTVSSPQTLPYNYGIYILNGPANNNGGNNENPPGSASDYKGVVFFRGAGFDLGLNSDEARRLSKLNFFRSAESSCNTSILNTDQSGFDVYSATKGEVEIHNHPGNLDGYKWQVWTTGMVYKKDTFWIKSGSVTLTNYNNGSGNTNPSVNENVSLSFIPSSVDKNSLVYLPLIRGFKVYGISSNGIGGKTLSVKVSQELSADGQSLQLNLTPIVKSFDGARTYNIVGHYQVIAYDPTHWGHKGISWHSANADDNFDSSGDSRASGSGSAREYWRYQTVDVGGDVESIEQAFVGFYQYGYNTPSNAIFEFDRFWAAGAVDSVTADNKLKIKMNGVVYGHEGSEASFPKRYLTPSELKGYVIYCKDPSVCKTSTGVQGWNESAQEWKAPNAWYSRITGYAYPTDLPAPVETCPYTGIRYDMEMGFSSGSKTGL